MPPDELPEGIAVSRARSGDQCLFRFSDLAVHHSSISCTGGLLELSLCRNETYDAREARTIRFTLYEIEQNLVSLELRFVQSSGRSGGARKKIGRGNHRPAPIFLFCV